MGQSESKADENKEIVQRAYNLGNHPTDIPHYLAYEGIPYHGQTWDEVIKDKADYDKYHAWETQVLGYDPEHETHQQAVNNAYSNFVNPLVASTLIQGTKPIMPVVKVIGDVVDHIAGVPIVETALDTTGALGLNPDENGTDNRGDTGSGVRYKGGRVRLRDDFSVTRAIRKQNEKLDFIKPKNLISENLMRSQRSLEKRIAGKGLMVGYLPGHKPAGLSDNLEEATRQMQAQASASIKESPYYAGPQYSYDYTNVPRLYNPYGIKTEANSNGVYIVPNIDTDILNLDKQIIQQIKTTYGPKFALHVATDLANQIKQSMALTTSYGDGMDKANQTRNEMIDHLRSQLDGFTIFKDIFVDGVKAIGEAMLG